MKTLLVPSNNLVEKYLRLFKKDDRYYLADQAIVKLFEKFPENKLLQDILLKISIINDLYSTNIFGTFLLAKHIQRKRIDTALAKGDATVVNRIATGHGIKKPRSDGDRNFYSFATKYCNWHNQNEYPIYDQFVHKALVAYKNKDGFSKFEDSDLRDYKSYKTIMIEFRKAYSLTQHSLKEIDKFLWMYGKAIFQKPK
jgi:hypothetical protein